MASRHDLVSVLVAVSGRTRAQDAISSVLEQTYRPLELIVVGGAADAEAALAARRAALRSARGAYVTLLDGDDVLLPAKIARQAAILDASPHLGAVRCRFHDMDVAGRVVDSAGRQPDGDLRAELLRSHLPWSGGPLVRRELLLGIGDDEPLDWFSDWGLWLRVALDGHDFGCVQEPLGGRRASPRYLTHHEVAARERSVVCVLEQAFRRWALPAEVMARREEIHAAWSVRFACRHAVAESAAGVERSLVRAATLSPGWGGDPRPVIELLHDEAMHPEVRAGDPVRMIETVLDHLPPAFASARAARSDLIARVHLALALQAHAGGDRGAARSHLACALTASPELLEAPDRFAAVLVGHARRIAAADPRSFVARVLATLPPVADGLERARALALAEVAIADTVRAHRLPVERRRAACVVSAAGMHRAEVMLRAERRMPGRLVERLRHANPRR